MESPYYILPRHAWGECRPAAQVIFQRAVLLGNDGRMRIPDAPDDDIDVAVHNRLGRTTLPLTELAVEGGVEVFPGEYFLASMPSDGVPGVAARRG